MLPAEIYQAHQVREIDRSVIQQHGIPGIVLMRRAADAAFKQIMTRYSRINHLVVVCGPGNNGGDGYIVALCARNIGIRVTVVAASTPNSGDAATAFQMYRDDGGVITECDYSVLATADLVVDALFGTGLSRAPEGAAAELIGGMNNAACPVVSLDIPSGLHSDTGAAFSACVIASVTITFIGLKLGLLTGQGRSHVGELVFEDLQIPAEARRAVEPVARIIQPLQLGKNGLEKYGREMHKGEAGRVLVVGADHGMLGAVLLAGEAALRCGCGVVTVASTESHLDLPALRRPELMSTDAVKLTPERVAGLADTIVLGPGLGQSAWSEQVFDRFIDCELPMVVDADGLNWLAQKSRHGTAVRRGNRVLTPHPGEAARLLHCTPAEVQADRLAAASEIAARYGGICVLKGTGTLVACVDGDGVDGSGVDGDSAKGAVYLCDRGNPGMATAGMGDVLSGIVGSLLGQGLPAIVAATVAVWMHSSAADAAADHIGERSLLAQDVIDRLASVIAQIEAH